MTHITGHTHGTVRSTGRSDAHRCHGRRSGLHRRRRTPTPSRPLSEGTTRQGGHCGGVRHQQLRCMHRPAGRQERQILLGARRAGRRQGCHDGRGAREGRRVAPRPGSVPRDACLAVRLLHSRHDHGDRRSVEREPRPGRRAGSPRARGKSLSLHGISEHRRCRAGRCPAHAGTRAEEAR